MTRVRPIPSEQDERAAMLVAVEVLVLWPSEPADGAETWPPFVLVVDEAAGTSWLVDHLDGDRGGESPVTSHCQWSVTVPGDAVLALSVRAGEPVGVDLEILVPRGRTPARRSTTSWRWAAGPPPGSRGSRTACVPTEVGTVDVAER